MPKILYADQNGVAYMAPEAKSNEERFVADENGHIIRQHKRKPTSVYALKEVLERLNYHNNNEADAFDKGYYFAVDEFGGAHRQPLKKPSLLTG